MTREIYGPKLQLKKKNVLSRLIDYSTWEALKVQGVQIMVFCAGIPYNVLGGKGHFRGMCSNGSAGHSGVINNIQSSKPCAWKKGCS